MFTEQLFTMILDLFKSITSSSLFLLNSNVPSLIMKPCNVFALVYFLTAPVEARRKISSHPIPTDQKPTLLTPSAETQPDTHPDPSPTKTPGRYPQAPTEAQSSVSRTP